MPNNIEDTISDLLPAQPLTGAELVPMDQGQPAATVHASVQQIANFIGESQTVISTSVSPIDTRDKFISALSAAINWSVNGNYVLHDTVADMVYHLVYIANGASNQQTALTQALIFYNELSMVQ